MRVLHVLHTSLPFLCGYSIRTNQILTRQKRSGIEVAALTSAQQPMPSLASGEDIEGIRYFRTSFPKLMPSPLRELQLARALARRLDDIVELTCPDIIHAHAPALVGLPAYRVATRRKIPLVYEVRDLWENAAIDHGKFGVNSIQHKTARALETWLLRRANAVVTICDALKQEIRSRVDRDVWVAPNGVDADSFQPLQVQLAWSEEWNPGGGPLIAYVGTFQPYEGLETLVEAMSNIVSHQGDVRLLIAGDGPDRERLELLARHHDVQDIVTFVGRVPHDRVKEIYAVADLLVYPRISTRTTRLTTPLKTLEALSMAKAVLVSDLAPMRELVADGKTGRLFQSGNPVDFADKALELLQDDEYRTKLGDAGRKWVKHHRRWSVCVELYDQIYRNLVSGDREV